MHPVLGSQRHPGRVAPRHGEEGWIDLDAGTVSASVRGAGRVELFDLDGLALARGGQVRSAASGPSAPSSSCPSWTYPANAWSIWASSGLVGALSAAKAVSATSSS